MILAAQYKHLSCGSAGVCLPAAVLLFIGCWLAPAAGVRAADAPAQGMFLIATRDLRGSGFAESVILLVQHDDNGSLGLIINKPTDVKPADLLTDIGEEFAGRLYIGGPVAAYGIILLLRMAHPPADAEHVFGDIYASGSLTGLTDAMKSPDAASRIRLYAGHAGWRPGQLDGEIGRGSWHVVPARESIIFSDDPGAVWRQLAPASKPIIVRRDDPGQDFSYR